MGQYCFARCRLSASSVVVCNAAGVQAGRPPGAWSSGRHCTAGQYGYVQLGRHHVCFKSATTDTYKLSQITVSRARMFFFVAYG